MNTKKNLGGVITALITPFKNNKVDLLMLEKLIKKQIEAKIDAILLFGTTGEPLSLSDSEKRLVFFTSKEIIQNKIPLLAGISSPCTATAVQNARHFDSLKSDGLLVITPYYYKCSSNGVYKHFLQIATATNLPIIAYNVPSRTNYDLTTDKKAYDRICNIDQIKAIKIAEGDLKRLKEIIKHSKIPVLCGCDEHALQSYQEGAIGSISVISNALPKLTKAIYNEYKNGDISSAMQKNSLLSPMVSLLSSLPNPIAIKYILAKTMGLNNELRLPLTKLTAKHAKQIDNLIFNLRSIYENAFN